MTQEEHCSDRQAVRAGQSVDGKAQIAAVHATSERVGGVRLSILGQSPWPGALWVIAHTQLLRTRAVLVHASLWHGNDRFVKSFP